MMIYRLW